MKRPPGRPPLDPDDPAVDVHIRLPSKHYDDVFKQAQHERLSVPEWIRRQLSLGTQNRHSRLRR